jgi:hypothetical protein
MVVYTLIRVCVGLFCFGVLRHIASSIIQSLILFDELVVFIQLTLLRLQPIGFICSQLPKTILHTG